MDGVQFDRLTLRLARAVTRRGLSGALAALVFAGLVAPETGAKRRKKKKKKKNPNPSCQDGTVRCDGDCVDTQTDEDHCGGCNSPCIGDLTCVGGQCLPVALCRQDADCFNNPNGNHCIRDASGVPACGCRPESPSNVRNCGPNGSCSRCCGDSECTEINPHLYCGYCTEPNVNGCTGGCGCNYAAGYSNCTSGCTDTLHDINNCGVCGRKCCSPASVCEADGWACLQGNCCRSTDGACF